jgi:hypothetical protein
MSEIMVALFAYILGIAWYTVATWFTMSGIYYFWRDKKSQPLQARINRISYEIEQIEGDKYKETPESTGLRRARDLDQLEMMDFEDHTEDMLRTYGAWRLLSKDPYSPTSRWKIEKRARLKKSLGLDA